MPLTRKPALPKTSCKKEETKRKIKKCCISPQTSRVGAETCAYNRGVDGGGEARVRARGRAKEGVGWGMK